MGLTIILALFLPVVFFLGSYSSYYIFFHLLDNYATDTTTASRSSNSLPNIVFIVADDLGWNDVSWHNPEILTPNLEKLANDGIRLNNYYVQPMCSPSRNSFMTGYYPYHTGLQHSIISPTSGYGLPLKFQMLPQVLKKEMDYKTHIVGKWHLGFCNWTYTPTFRGFDSFYGYYIGAEDYYKHTRRYGLRPYIDFRDNQKVVLDQNETYSAFTFTNKAIEVIKTHETTNPLFLYLPFQNVHEPLEVPKRFEDLYPNIKHRRRRVFSGMVSALDEAVGNITKALEEKGIMDNTVLIFTTDNGGQPVFGGNNFPLRGTKHTLWEGGTRGVAFINSKKLPKSGFQYNGMMHATDWFPTILDIAGIKTGTDIDGKSLWTALKSNATSPRNEFVYNIDKTDENGAIRVGNYKLIVGVPGNFNDWYPAPKVDNTFNIGKGDLSLYDVVQDPTEHNNLTAKFPQVANELFQRFQEYKKSEVPPLNRESDPKSNPKNFGGAWSPGWC